MVVEPGVLGSQVVETVVGFVVEGQAVDLPKDGAVVASGFVEVRVSGAQGEDVEERAGVQELEAAQGWDGIAVGVVFESVGEAVVRPPCFEDESGDRWTFVLVGLYGVFGEVADEHGVPFRVMVAGARSLVGTRFRRALQVRSLGRRPGGEGVRPAVLRP
ncbi:hypothetical protein AN221_16385 [Streptomyces nanshensis]|uniref:Uncharacterized protein n=1 Tax=Streptomyces nanshensis TaxID=518642 RepID=A0A1E7LT85_9ACTN|nr:hypothetical protein AN221_16385 [Streptomyces nanshensis]